MRTKKLKIIFLLLVGVLSTLPAMAEEYIKTITVLQQGQVVPVEDFYFNSLDGERKPSRVEVKNGAEFYIQLQQDHQIESLSGGTLEEKKIRISKPGILFFFISIDGKKKKFPRM